MSLSISAPNFAPSTARKWVKQGTATALAAVILLSSPAAVRSIGGTSAVSPSPVVSVVASTAISAVAGAATAVAPLPAVPVPAPEVQKRFNVGPILNWLWTHARWLWNGFVNAVYWGWSSFLNMWNSWYSWVRAGITWYIGSYLWDFYKDVRHYFFGW